MIDRSPESKDLDALSPDMVVKANVLLARALLQRSGLSDDEIDGRLRDAFGNQWGLSLSEVAADLAAVDVLRQSLGQASRVPELADAVRQAVADATDLPGLTAGDTRSVIVKGLLAVTLVLAARIGSITGEGVTFYEGMPVDVSQLSETVDSIVDGPIEAALGIRNGEHRSAPPDGRNDTDDRASAEIDETSRFPAPMVISNNLPEPRAEVLHKRNAIFDRLIKGDLDLPYYGEPEKAFRGGVPNNVKQGDPPYRVGVGLAYSGQGADSFRIAVRLQSEAQLKQKCWDELEKIFERCAGSRIHMKRTRPVVLQHQRNRQLKDRRRPLIMGSSISVAQGPYCTLGCFVRRRDSDGPVMILGSGHALSNFGLAGYDAAIYQPATGTDAEDLEDRIAILEEHYLPVTLSGATNAGSLDYALASLLQDIRHEATLVNEIGTFAGVAELDWQPQDPAPSVQKWTVFSGRTEGSATAESLIQPALDPSTGRVVHLIDVIEIRAKDDNMLFSGGGDSGALVLDSSRRGLGIINAGTDRREKKHAGRSYATPLSLILGQSNLELAGP